MITEEQYEIMKGWIYEYEKHLQKKNSINLFNAYVMEQDKIIYILDKTHERPDEYLPYLKEYFDSRKINYVDYLIVLDLQICNGWEMNDIGKNMFYLYFKINKQSPIIEKITQENHNYDKYVDFITNKRT